MRLLPSFPLFSRRTLNLLRGALALTLSLLSMRGIGLLGEMKISHSSPTSYLRVSFRFRPPLIHQCHEPNPGELVGVPIHMRPREICTRGFVPYRLRVEVDGKEKLDLWLNPKGAQHDRPIGVDELLSLLPGEHFVALTLVPREGNHPSLTFFTPVTLALSQVVVITLEEDRRFRLLSSPE